jgi:type I restriction enzyme S subunit
MTAGKDAKSMVTPRLRFPEFRNHISWGVDYLVEVARFVNDKAPVSESSETDYVSTQNLLSDYGGKTRALKLPTTGAATRYWIGDVLVSNIRPYLKKIWIADQDGYASNDVIVVRAKQKLSKTYLSLVLKNDAFITYVMRGAKGVKMPRGDIDSMRDYPVAYPSPTEQQKIADCLTSLDEVIVAQGRKVDALKAHKRGLMQQLFPCEGETVPRLRFPEFRDGAEWKVKSAGRLFTNRKEDGEGGLPIYSVTVNDGMIPRASFDRNFYDIEDPAGNKKACEGDIAYNMMRMWQGAQGVAVEDCMVSPAYVVLSPLKGVCSDFFAYLFKLSQSLELLTAYSRGLTKDRLRLYFDDFARMPLCVPRYDEQRRIADCLSALDTRIVAESNQLDALKTHKQGLMQQLFPSPEGAAV